MSYAAANIAPGSLVTSSGRPTAPEFKWVNIGPGNIKSAITGTCRSCSPQYSDRYLAAYDYRFNRRFQLDKMVELLATTAMATAPSPYEAIVAAEILG